MIAYDGLDVYIGSNIKIRLKEKVKKMLIWYFLIFLCL